jgi:hypothetical protein
LISINVLPSVDLVAVVLVRFLHDTGKPPRGHTATLSVRRFSRSRLVFQTGDKPPQQVTSL